MNTIKTKDSQPKTIKTLNKATTWTERVKDQIVSVNEKSKDAVTDSSNNYLDYGESRIKQTVNHTKDGAICLGQKTAKKTISNIDKIFNKESKIKTDSNLLRKKRIKESTNTIKTSNVINRKNTQITKESRKRAIDSVKKTAEKTKRIVKKLFELAITTIKGIIGATKSLIALLGTTGAIACLIIIIICLVGLLCTSYFGVFFSSENVGNNIKISDCITELNEEMDNRIENIKNSTYYNEVVINSNKAEWKEILAVYTVRILNEDKNAEVMTINQEKKKVLEDTFWDMNTISSYIKIEDYKDNDAIGTLEKDVINNDELGNQEENQHKKVLYININSKSMTDMKILYEFDENITKQLDELLDDKYLPQWNAVIYGSYGSSEEIKDWKQYDKKWMDIEVGNSGKTLGDIGCLITSVAILIKKSDIPTKKIYPFNPGTFLIALNNNYGFDESGNLRYSAISKSVPNFIYQGNINLRGKSKSEKLYEIKKYYEDGYYISIEVKGATKNSQHWVALDSIINNKILMLDPANEALDMWKKYDWDKTSQFVYFKKT